MNIILTFDHQQRWVIKKFWLNLDAHCFSYNISFICWKQYAY